MLQMQPSLQWEVIGKPKYMRPSQVCSGEGEENQAGEEGLQRRAPPVLAPGGSASRQFLEDKRAKRNPERRGTQVIWRQVFHTEKHRTAGTQIICQRINVTKL